MTGRCRRVVLVIAWAILAGVSSLHAQVSFDRILRAERTPDEWLTYNGGLSAQRHSPLAQITPANVKNLELQWVFQARSLDKFEASPLVVDGILYTVHCCRMFTLIITGFITSAFAINDREYRQN